MRDIWQLWSGIVTAEECDYIIKAGEEAPEEKGTVYSNPEEGDSDIRKSNISWIRNNPEIDRIQNYFFSEANRNAYGFDVNYMPSAQFGTYGKGDFYNWHHDVNWELDSVYDRKLSIVIQLSDPNDYEGGDFEFSSMYPQPEGFRERGSVLVFPSYIPHRVTEITKGTRKSLVNWLEGPRWR
tara:strand:- start:57 stop:602 length:546 start_codon:yes stop_codon:yes gene_type:complete